MDIDKNSLREAMSLAEDDFASESASLYNDAAKTNWGETLKEWGPLQILATGASLGASALTGIDIGAYVIPEVKVDYPQEGRFFPKASKIDKMDKKLRSKIIEGLPSYYADLKKQERNWIINKANERYNDKIRLKELNENCDAAIKYAGSGLLGGVIGGVAGGLIGSNVDNRDGLLPGAAIGTGLGAATGAGLYGWFRKKKKDPKNSSNKK